MRRWLVVLTGLALAPLAPARVLEWPQPLAQPGVLKETAAQTARLASLLASGDEANRIRVVVGDLRARYPGIENAEIVNYLMAAYCSVVAQLSGLSEQEKRTRLDLFVSQLSQIIF